MEVTRAMASDWLEELQDSICGSLEVLDGKAKFAEDVWKRGEGGGGRTRIIKEGSVFEKGGVLFSAVHGDAPAFLLKEAEHSLPVGNKDKNIPQFFATGVSIVLHPVNPMVPII